MLEQMVQPFNGLQFVLRARWQSATQSAKIARRLHLHILRTIKGKDRTGDVSKQRTDIQSQEMLHIGSLELHDCSSKVLGQRSGKIILAGRGHRGSSYTGIKDFAKGLAISVNRF